MYYRKIVVSHFAIILTMIAMEECLDMLCFLQTSVGTLSWENIAAIIILQFLKGDALLRR